MRSAQAVLVTGASSGFGAMTVRALAQAGHQVWAGIRATTGRNAPAVAELEAFAGKAAEDSLAVSYAAELARFGVETTIVVPGSFTTGTNHFAHAGHPADENVEQAYEVRYAGLMDQVGRRLAALSPPHADPAEVARVITAAVDAPRGTRPSACTSTPRTTVPRRSTGSATEFGATSTAASVSRTC